MSNLDHFKSEVAQLFFSLSASDGYLLAGGGALLANDLSERPTEDLDFFGNRNTREMAIVSRVFELAAIGQGWRTKPIRRTESFVRLQVHGSESVAIDFCRDTPATESVTHTPVGPTYSGPELAGRKMLALFSRAAARDFADVYLLAIRFGRDSIFSEAKKLDAGFGVEPFVEAIARLAIFKDADLPIDQERIPKLREFFRTWAAELSA